MTRRDLLASQSTLAASAALPSLSSTTARAASLSGVAEAYPFSIEWLKAEAKRLAQEPFLAPGGTLPDWIANLE